MCRAPVETPGFPRKPPWFWVRIGFPVEHFLWSFFDEFENIKNMYSSLSIGRTLNQDSDEALLFLKYNKDFLEEHVGEK